MNLKELEKLNEFNNLYEILNIDKEATSASIKKSYYKLALKYHPDKLPNVDELVREEAKKYFQRVQIAYNILSDTERKERYDLTGRVPEFDGEGDEGDLGLDPINLQDIENFAKEYLNSDQEKQDLIALNEKYKGDVNKIMDGAMLRENEDEDTVVNIIQGAIDAEETEEYSNFKKTLTSAQKSKRKKAAEKQRKQFEKDQKSDKKQDLKDLAQLILANSQKRSTNFLDQLEEKYCQPKGGKRSKKPADEEIDDIINNRENKIKKSKGTNSKNSKAKSSKN